MTLRYTLRIEAPDGFDIEGSENYDRLTLEEILEDAEPHDTTLEAQVLRWLSDPVADAESAINNSLPNGWYCKIEDVVLR